MSGCPSFKIQIRDNINDALVRVQQVAAGSGLSFSGNAQQGSFSGRGVAGNYTVSGNVVTIQVTQLGFPASMRYNCSSIEAEVRKFFNK